MIGIDVGGANLKIAHDNGVDIHYCPLWKNAPLKEILLPYQSDQMVAVVMSGELADSFSSKEEGVLFIFEKVREVFPNARFYGTDGCFHSTPHKALAAANWFAMVECFREVYPDALLVDMGSTTTDIIPLNAYELLLGQTDLSRLQQGYMLYLGTLRTPVSSLLRFVQINHIKTPVSTEFFACSGDVHVALNILSPTHYSTPTPDGEKTDLKSCIRRLGRVVCAEIEEIGEEGAYNIALSYEREERALITSTIHGAAEKHGLTKILCAGIGSSILKTWTGGIDLGEKLGEYADALPAYAVREVALRNI